MFSWIFLIVAVLGTCTSAVFLAMSLLGARKFHRARRIANQERRRADCPPVSVLKPLHGLEPHLRENLESFYRQDYPSYEILFAVDTENDPAAAVAREVSRQYPQIPTRILVTGEAPWPNPPAWCFSAMAEAAANDIFVTSDSDVFVGPSYLREIVSPLLAPRIGMVTCVYRGHNAGGFWSGMDAIGMSVEMTAGVLTANLLEGMKFGLGPTIAIRRDSLAAAGGYATLADYFANDFMIGNLIAKAGYEVRLSDHIIDHVVAPMSFSQMWRRQIRWAASTRFSRPKGHFGSVLTFSVPYGILGLIAGLLSGHTQLGVALFVLCVLNRMTESLAIGWGVVRDRVCLRSPWLYPVRDLLGFALWLGSYFTRRSLWRSGQYTLVKGGKIIRTAVTG